MEALSYLTYRGSFGDFDFAQSESRARKLYYAKDDWEDVMESNGTAVFGEGIQPGERGPETWYRTLGRQLPKSIQLFFLNWLDTNAKSDDWDSELMASLQVAVDKGTKKMSQTALVELAARNAAESGRTGEQRIPIYWPDALNLGDVNPQQLAIGDLEFSALGYGDRLSLPLQLREALNKGRNVEEKSMLYYPHRRRPGMASTKPTKSAPAQSKSAADGD